MLHIQTPCHEDWAAMTPRSTGRHCAVCDKTVLDVSGLAPERARALIDRDLPARLAQGEKVCVRSHADRRGRLLRPGQRLLTNGLAAVLAMTMAGAGGSGAGLQAADGQPLPAPLAESLPASVEESLMGDVAVATPIRGEVVQTLTMGKVVAEEPPAPLPIAMGEACVPEVPAVTALETPEGLQPLSAQQAARLTELTRQAEGRWRDDLVIPMIAPTTVMIRSDGSRLSCILGRFLQGPRGVVEDPALVTAIQAELITPGH